MIKFTRLLVVACLALFVISCNSKRPGKPKVLVFSKTGGYRHASIGAGKLAIMKLGQENGFDVDTTENADYFTEDSLKNYSAVIFLSTTGDVLKGAQENDFERYIQAGGGFVGVHAATDTEYDWGWYGRMVGGYFESHPEQQEAVLNVVDATHISTKHLPAAWKRKDEWYNFQKLSKDVHVLIKIDEKSYKGGKLGDNHPMAWYHDYDGGRAFYTELGHTDESWTEDNYLKHLLGGIQYAIGDNNNLNYGKATTLRVPDEDRFTKTVLSQGTLFEPTEMSVLPNLDVLIAQRRGELMMYKNETKTMKQVGYLNVYWKTEHTPNVNAEEGFIGLKADPNYDKNHFVYVMYCPKDTSVNRLSRFVFDHDSLHMASEKIILQFYSQREICCHTGGSIDFAGDGKTLFVSAGDNSTPFDEPNQPYVNHGFGPLDDRPGHEQYDARRSSGNTNDLRGKILRIRLKEDGSYEIPEGNLFAPGTPNTRPEIYVMGNRNPYRISVDKKTGWLYWGEVGPDASNDSLDTRGPRGYDELNQARKAGFFGWPLFVGKNYAYRSYDYATGTSGAAFDTAKPINNSRNNTGLQQLPAVSPPFIWYPYGASSDFPQVGSGGRNAMAGASYYTDMYPKETRLPDYYNGKVFISDWIRGWIKVVTLQPNGDFDKMEPFMEHTKLNSMIDFEVGPDGRIYQLEYGSGWFSRNADAGLSRIDYNGGNRAPKVTDLKVDKTSGSLPLTINATVEARDPEKDPLTYKWSLGNGIVQETKEPTLTYTIQKAGDYALSVQVFDDKRDSVNSKSIEIYAGNEAPKVTIAVTGNQSFYLAGKPVQYVVNIEDKDDTSAKDLNNLVVAADYMEGTDKAAAALGHLVTTEVVNGKTLMLSLDCKTCHKEAEKSVGPAYLDVAKKYEKDPNAVTYLVGKIINGGSGAWGEVAMPAHPTLREVEAKQIVTYIQSLAKPQNAQKSLPASGSLPATLNKPVKDNGVLYITATYTDKGGNGIKPLSNTYTLSLPSSKTATRQVDSMQGYSQGPRRSLLAPKAGGWYRTKPIDLTQVSGATVSVGWQKPTQFGYTFELRLDAPDGQKIGSFSVPAGGEDPAATKKQFAEKTISLAIQPITDGKKHKLYVISKPLDASEPNQVAILWLEFK